MAGRTIDININYKFDTSQLQNAQKFTEQAQKATDNLRQSTAQAGAAGANAFKPFVGSIETLNAKLLSLKDRIIQSSDPTKVKQLSDQYKVLKVQLDAATKAAFDTGKALKETANNTQSMASGFGDLVGAVKLFLTAGLVKELVASSLELSKMAGNVQGVKTAFDRLPNSIVLLDDLKKKTHGTVTEFELMKKAVFASDFGIPVKNLGTLLEFASARAQQTGLSVDYLVDSIVRGIGQKSILRLDNLGLSAERLKNELGGASLKAKSIGEVTEAVTKIAQEELGKMGGYVETSATKVDQLASSWDKLGKTVAKWFESGGIPTQLKKYVDAITLVIEASQRNVSVQTILRESAAKEAAILGVNIIKQDLFNDSKEYNLDITKQAIQAKTHELIQNQEEIKALEARQKALFKLQAQQNVGPEFRNNIKQIETDKKSNQVLIEQIKILKQLSDSLASEIVAPKKMLDNLKEMEEKVKDLNDAIQEKENISTKASQDEARLLKFQRDAIQDNIDRIKETIFWEEELDRRRKSKSVTKQVTNLDADKIKSTLTPLANQGKAINDLTNQSQYLFEALGRIEAGFSGIENGAIHIKAAKDKFIDLRTELEKAIDANKQFIQDTGIGIVQDQLNSVVQAEADAYNVRINNLNKFYDNQIRLAGDNQRAQNELEVQRTHEVAKLQKEQFQKDKQVKKLQAIINGAAAAARAFVDYEYPASLVIAALAAAEVASQVAIIDRQQPGFAKGVIDLKGPGTTTSDSIPARLSKGESVMTANETFRAKGVLEMVRANKLDDTILRQLKLSSQGVKYVGMNDERIVNAIQGQQHPDFLRISDDIYQVRQSKYKKSKVIKRKAIRNG